MVNNSIDFGIKDQKVPFLVMDYTPNGTLRDRHPKGERLPLPTIVRYVQQIASALQYAHEHRRIHRDIKPENILIGTADEIWMADFGISVVAHREGSSIQQNSALTPQYAPIEQWEGFPVSMKKIALFGYEMDGGWNSTLWNNPEAFMASDQYKTRYDEWCKTKRDFTPDEILNSTWVKVSEDGRIFTVQFLSGGSLNESDSKSS